MISHLVTVMRNKVKKVVDWLIGDTRRLEPLLQLSNPCITRASVVRYSFTVTDFHRLPLAGLPAHPSIHDPELTERHSRPAFKGISRSASDVSRART